MWSPAMTWAEWEPVYECIRSDFGFDRSADEAARDQLAASVGTVGMDPAELPNATDRSAVIVGAGALSNGDVETIDRADIVISASAATATLRDLGIESDLHVTDLDDPPGLVPQLSDEGVPLAIHAHGDNREAIATILPQVSKSRVFPTTQVAPVAHVFNPGGFTDGDRAAYLAHAIGAAELRFAGWVFDDPGVDVTKRAKLGWAARLLHWLECHRGERFSILDDRREELDIAAFPDP